MSDLPMAGIGWSPPPTRMPAIQFDSPQAFAYQKINSIQPPSEVYVETYSGGAVVCAPEVQNDIETPPNE